MKKNTRNITGMNVYQDQYGNYVYYNFLNKKAYIIEPEDDDKFRILKDRYLFVFIAFVLLYGVIDVSTTTFALLMASSFIIFEVYFRFKYLPKLRSYDDFVKTKRVFFSNDGVTKKKNFLVGILYLVFAVLIVVNAIIENYDAVLLAISIIIALFASLKFLFALIGIFKKN